MVAPLLIVSSSGWACTRSRRREGVTRSILQRPDRGRRDRHARPLRALITGLSQADTAGHAAVTGNNRMINCGTSVVGETAVSPHSTSTGTTVRASAKWQAEGWP
jgi:hypothetical protein